jgi:hypothetical protein
MAGAVALLASYGAASGIVTSGLQFNLASAPSIWFNMD